MQAKYYWALIVLTLLGASCSKNQEKVTQPYRMGERLQIGSLSYTVLEADWRSQLGQPGAPRTPGNRFLVVRLSVTNGGASAVLLPALVVEDAGGKEYPELTEGASIENWLGPLRSVKPAETLEGRVLFDVPFGPAKLRITDVVDHVENPAVAHVDIPVQFEQAAPAVDPGRAGGQAAVPFTGPPAR